MNSKQFATLKGWIDYDRPFLSSLTYEQKIIWFQRRLNLVLIKPIKYVYRGVSLSSKQSALLILATSICCAIEAMGKFCCGNCGNKHDQFRHFIKRYMASEFILKTINNRSYEWILWKYFRNGLAHGFAVCHGGFEHQATYFSVRTIGGKQTLVIDPQSFLRDFLDGIKNYLADLQSASSLDSLAQDFERVFKEVFIDGN